MAGEWSESGGCNNGLAWGWVVVLMHRWRGGVIHLLGGELQARDKVVHIEGQDLGEGRMISRHRKSLLGAGGYQNLCRPS